MKHIWECRRTGLAFIGLAILGVALFIGKVDTSTAIASICIGLATANSIEKKQTPFISTNKVEK